MPASSRSKKSSSKVSKKSARKVAKKATKKTGKKVAKKAAKKVDKKVAKKGARKTPRRSQSTRRKAGKVSPERRHEMIETAAYYRAVKRNFQDGDDVADWLSGEKEIDVFLSNTDP